MILNTSENHEVGIRADTQEELGNSDLSFIHEFLNDRANVVGLIENNDTVLELLKSIVILHKEWLEEQGNDFRASPEEMATYHQDVLLQVGGY